MTRSHPQTRINLTYAQVSGDTLPGSDGGDLTGNMTTIPRVSAPGTAQTTVYDAWNRLVELRQGGSVIADYKYDGRGRRIFKYTGLADESRDFYYSNAWQDLEERVSGTADTQYVWGLRYVDELICRDYDSDSNGTLEQRMYALQDANFNLTSIVDTSGDPQERYIYSPYGVRSFLTPFFASRSSSSYLWNIGHQGLMHDYESGLIYNRARMLHPKLGRFMQRDPLGYADGSSLFEYEIARPVGALDEAGTYIWVDMPIPVNYVLLCKKSEPDCSNCWETCKAETRFYSGRGGYVICRPDGCKCACVSSSFPGGPRRAQQILFNCALAHEEYHVQSPRIVCPGSDNPNANRISRFRGWERLFGNEMTLQELKEYLSLVKDEECFASAVEINCLCQERKQCDGIDCVAQVNRRIKQLERYCLDFGGDVYKHGATRCP